MATRATAITTLADNPHYSMAELMRAALDSGAPPSAAILPMTPEEVAASYDEAEQERDNDPGADDSEFGDPGLEPRSVPRDRF